MASFWMCTKTRTPSRQLTMGSVRQGCENGRTGLWEWEDRVVRMGQTLIKTSAKVASEGGPGRHKEMGSVEERVGSCR